MNRLIATTLVLLAYLTVSAGIQASEKPGFTWKDQPEKKVADLYFNGNPVLQYVYPYDDSSKESFHDTYKVFHHVYGPGSKKVITKGPGGKYTPWLICRLE